jgi:hypothetical protein
MGTSVNGQGPVSLSDVTPSSYGSGGANLAPNQGGTNGGVPSLGIVLAALLARLGTPVANVAALQATVAADRADGMLVVTLDSYTPWVWKAGDATAADAAHIAPTDVGAGNGRFVNLLDAETTGGFQSGSSTLVAGVSPAIPANITAQTKIVVSRTAANASTALGELAVTTKTPGAPGSFVVKADTQGTPGTPLAADVSSFDWIALG